MSNYMGKDGFIWWQGVVEDRHDPLYLGRCRIRILGWHTEDKVQMPTESLPWSHPIQPITSAAQTGVGISPTGPVEGTWVVGFYRDGEAAQEPVFFGTLGGIPTTVADNPFQQIGFGDPRVSMAEIEEVEQEHPFISQKSRILDNTDDIDLKDRVPTKPKRLRFYAQGDTLPESSNTFKYTTKEPTGAGISTDNQTGRLKIVVEELAVNSRYPNIDYLEEPTTPRMARGVYGNVADRTPEGDFGIIGQKQQWRSILPQFDVAEVGVGETWSEPKPTSMWSPRYPYNHVHESESGHLMEVDDTPGKERLHWYHRAGTFTEIGSLGQRVSKIANEDFTIRLMNDYEAVLGSKYINVAGKLDIVSERAYHHRSRIFNVKTTGATLFDTSQFNVKADRGITIDSGGGPLVLRGHTLVKEFVTSENTDKVTGNSTTEVGGKLAIRSGSYNVGSRGTAGITAGGAINLVASDNIQESCLNLAGALGAPARSFKSGIGEIIFETAVPGASGAFSFNAGPFGALGSITMNSLGEIELKACGGLATLKLGLAGISLSYSGVSTLDLTPSGASMEALAIASVKGTAQAKVEGALVNVEASGINTVKGSLVMIN
tara:strand:- start:63 stop:1871 length:1809 start_codon:yes stop_codon:yes gene_type:complete